jgi:hypothetical protein
VVSLFVGVAWLKLSWEWSRDDFAAGVIADRLVRLDSVPNGTFDVPDAPDPTWWNSTAAHLHLRALAASRGERDPKRDEQVRFLLGAAKSAAPLDPAVRMALAGTTAHAGERPHSASSLNLSRDIVALRREARHLLDQGNTEAALRIDRDAMTMAVEVDLRRAPFPAFNDAADVRRFLLPHEAEVAGIVRDLATHRGWRFADWSRALPPNGIAALAAYRVLLEAGSIEATQAYEQVMAATPDPTRPVAASLLLASQAEALALDARWKESAARYRDAIELMPDDAIRRTWWINVAEVAARTGNTDLMRKAWTAARGPSPGDEINERMAESRARQGFDKSTGTRSYAKANTARRSQPGLSPQSTRD